MSAPFEITRALADDDLSEIAVLQERTFTNPWSTESIRHELAKTDVARLYVMRQNLRIVAYCACWVIIDELHLNSVAVDPDRRREGLGRELLRAVCRDAVAAGVTKATLEVRRSNTAAIGLYEHLGFSVEAVRVDYYEQPREDALLLWCRTLADV